MEENQKKNNKKIGLIIIGIVLVIVIIIGTILLLPKKEINETVIAGNTENTNETSKTNNEDNENKEIENTNATNNENAESKKEEFFKTEEDNTKVNISPNIARTRTLDGLEISNIEITSRNDVGQFLADVTNKTNEKKGNFPVSIKVLDKEGKEITTIHGFIKSLNSGEKTKLGASKTFDFSNAYNISIEKE